MFMEQKEHFMITSFAQDEQFLAIPLGSLEKRLACTHDANVKQQWLLRKNIVPSFTTLCGLFLKMKQMIAWFKYCDSVKMYSDPQAVINLHLVSAKLGAGISG